MAGQAVLPLPLFWLSILAPSYIALAFEAFGLRRPGHARILAYASSVFLLLPSLLVLWLIYIAGYDAIRDPLVIDLRAQGFGAMSLVVDKLSGPIVIGVSIVTAVVSVYSIRYMSHRIDEMEKRGAHAPPLTVYYSLYSAFAASMLGVAMSTNMIQLFVFLELSLITSFLLIAIYGYGDRFKVALIYFVWTHLSSSLILLGILYFGLRAGTFDLLDPITMEYVTDYSRAEIGGLAVIVPILVTIGLLIKLAAFGVHVWLPYAHAEAPTPVSALLSPNMVGLAGYLLARMGILLFGKTMELLSLPLLLLALASIVFGGLLALSENDTKRLLAYSSVSQMGYILLGLATLSDYGVAGAMLHYLAHAIGKAVLFMIAGVFIVELEGLRNIDRAGGLAKSYPVTTGLAIYGFLHLMGMPPAMGLWSKLLILFGLVQAYWGAPLRLALIAVAASTSFLVTVFYATSAISRIFFGTPRGEHSGEESLDELKLTILILSLLGLVFFALAVAIADDVVLASRELLVAGGAER